MCLASNYPVCGFLHYNEDVFKLVLELAQGSDISSRMADTVLLHTECPILGALFTISCVHGICYGFQIMDDVESPNIPFTIMRTRFNTGNFIMANIGKIYA
ncbi:hypothetical protein DPMN_035821 [Dreissena polymorpha]|uniref:Uncharacterized protein n=1 Tax=Dreissena polymorpha TaxID=45954 RepID=A0A9D4M812_DREPO|nr:hypothetical protein DPMN_035821 [Dreissena polymorpha]